MMNIPSQEVTMRRCRVFILNSNGVPSPARIVRIK
jgi:hypothetical protein